MAAPALVALATGSRDPRTDATATALGLEIRALRPDLRVEVAFTGPTRPGLDKVVTRLARAGHDEVVVVPLALVAAEPGAAELAAVVSATAAAHPGVGIRSTEVVGLSPRFLGVLDERLRAALRVSRVRELDALVLAGAGSTDALVNASVARLARLWGSRHRLPVAAAYAGSAPPATGEAVRAFRAQGRRHIAVGSLFLSPGPLHARAAELASEAGAVAVSDPLGAHPEVAREVLARYAVGAVELVPV